MVTPWRQNSRLIKISKLLCFLFLHLLAAAEAVIAAALARGYVKAVPSWQRMLGWVFFALSLALFLSAVYVLEAFRAQLGFFFIAASQLLYAAYIFTVASEAHFERRSWIHTVILIACCAIGVGAARVLTLHQWHHREAIPAP
jgi:hypothetical protein